ncbi:MAG TPA: chemotaxis protein CheB, partial [Leptospiraceae bacterium]|nr:chemotaxis protein CheB [Leptospiraceae bacterium]
KPSSAVRMNLEEIGQLLKSKILGYFDYEDKKKAPRVKIKVGNFPEIKKTTPVRAIAIGTSTGGPNALQAVFKMFPEDFYYPVFIVQHMPAGFTKAFAERLNEISKIRVKRLKMERLFRQGLHTLHLEIII